jgi:uncharacterized protein
MTLPLWMANKITIMFKKIFFLFVFLTGAISAFAQIYPDKTNTLVTDYTNSLTPDQKQRLESKLVAFDDSSSTQLAVVIMRSVGDNDIAEYAVGLGRKWGVGQKGKNNGILLLAAMQDHKVTIQVGYGDEGALPDITAKQIIDNDITPQFKQGNFYGGLDIATDHIIQYTKGEYKADKKAGSDDSSTGGSIAVIIVIIIVVLLLIFRNRGGGGHIIGGRGSASPFWWFLAGDVLGSSGRGGGWGGGSGGFGGGGGGGGGGFGGFGGGSFGGGGASGGW